MSEKAFRIGPIRPPSEANSLLIQITNGCTWNKCKFCNIYRDTKFKAYSAESIRRDIDNIAYWAQRVQKHRLDPAGRAMGNRTMGDSATGDHTMEDGYSYLSGRPRWDIDGINAELQSMTDEDDRQSYYTVANWLLPHVAKYDKISKDAYPNLKWGSTGYSYKDYPGKGKEGKGALLAYGEVIAGFHRTLASDDRPTFKLDDGREVKGSENYDIEVLVGGCKGNCVIEATSTYTKRMDPASYKKPHVEKKVLVPFDKTYVRHDENGKKWVTHEKCGTK